MAMSTSITLMYEGELHLPTNEQLNKLFESKVRPGKDQTSEIIKSLMPDLEKIFKFIHDNDYRFSEFKLPVGSYYQGLKIIRSDEFDFTLFLDFGQFGPVYIQPAQILIPGPLTYTYTQCCTTNSHYGFRGFDDNVFWAKAHISPQAVSDRDGKPTETNLHITVDSSYKIEHKFTPLPPPSYGYHTVILTDVSSVQKSLANPPLSFKNCREVTHLIPFSVKVRLKELIDGAIKSCKFEGELTFQPRAHGPALTVKYNHPSDGIPFQTSVDITAALRGKTLEELDIQWPVSQQWPPSALVQYIKKTNVMFVAKRNFYWRISFAECEKKLSKFCERYVRVDERGVSDSCRKRVHRIMKFWHNKFWCPHANPGISSYILKTVWLFEMERIHDDEQWRSCHLRTRLFDCIVSLVGYVVGHLLSATPHVNAIEDIFQIVWSLSQTPAISQNSIMHSWYAIRNWVDIFLNRVPRHPTLPQYFDRSDNLLQGRDADKLKTEIALIIVFILHINEWIHRML